MFTIWGVRLCTIANLFQLHQILIQTGALHTNSSLLEALRNCLGSCALESQGRGQRHQRPTDHSSASLLQRGTGGKKQIHVDKHTRGSENWSRCDSRGWTRLAKWIPYPWLHLLIFKNNGKETMVGSKKLTKTKSNVAVTSWIIKLGVGLLRGQQ